MLDNGFSSDYMIRVEVALMDELNQNRDSWLECHQSMWQCHMLGAVVPHAAVTFCSMKCHSIDDSML